MNATSVPATKPVVKGDVVRYKGGYQRVSAVFKNSVNLAGIFSTRINHKKVPLSEVTEAHDEWYKKWQESETYKCM